MENFLPVLLIVAGVIYKIYTEYQKEQEKARKRRPNIPPAVPANTVPPIPNPQQYKKPAVPAFPTPARSVTPPKPAIKKVEMQQRPLEVTKVQEQKKVRREKQRIEAIEAPKLEILTEQHIDFDLRKAVIQSAILERPYRD